MDQTLKIKALTKLAFFGSTWVPGSPSFGTPSPTVGQAIYNLNSQLTSNTNHNTNNVYMSALSSMPSNADLFINSAKRRSVTDKIVGTGLNVNSPVKSLFHAGIGALAGNFIANAMRTGPFVRGLMTATGANYGYNH